MLVTYRGQLVNASNGEEDRLVGLVVEGVWKVEILADLFRDDMARGGRFATVRYFISNAPMMADELTRNLVRIVTGLADASYGMRYSELTGYLWTDEEMVVGGHDLLEELRSSIGEYLHMEVKFSTKSIADSVKTVKPVAEVEEDGPERMFRV